jgi:two-component system, NtrC family, nitrogen regulation response regulator GlnG
VESPEESAPTILIADDDALIRLVLERALRTRGYEVTAAATRNDCIEAYTSSNVNLIILDAHMPGNSLEQTLELMSEHRPLPHTIIMSGDGERPDWLPADKRYVSKPFDLTDFLEVVALHLAGGDSTTRHDDLHS